MLTTTDFSPPVTPADPPGRFIEIGRGPLHIVDEGSPSAEHVFVMVHGIPGSVRDFRYLGPALARSGVRVIRVDMPGFGLSPSDTFPGTTAENRAALVVRLADVLGLSRFSLVGHSHGGGVCMTTAALYRERVTSLVLLASIGAIRHRAFPKLPSSVFSAYARGLEQPGIDLLLAEFMRRAYAGVGLKIDVPAHALAHWVRLIDDTSFATHRFALSKLTCPTLVVSADDDVLVEPHIPLDTAARLDKRRVAVRHLKLAHGGHFVQKNAASLVADAVVEMVRHHSGPLPV